MRKKSNIFCQYFARSVAPLNTEDGVSLNAIAHPSICYTWTQATRRWCEEMKHKRSIQRDVDKFRYLADSFGQLDLSDITRSHIHAIVLKRQNAGCKPATINAYLALIKAVLRKARDEWEWVKEIPYIKMLKMNNHRIRWLNKEECDRILKELPTHLRRIANMALETGQRMTNICRMRFKDIDFVKGIWTIPPSQSKNGQQIEVFLQKKVIDWILDFHNSQCSEYVHLYKGKPILKANSSAWRKALKRAGLPGVHFHDLRHTWASRHAQAGTPMHVLQQLGGWKSSACMQRYVHLSEEQLKKAAENIV